MNDTEESYYKLLYQGGSLHINKMGDSYDLDVFALEYEDGDDPVYHRRFATMKDAMAVADQFRGWDDYD